MKTYHNQQLSINSQRNYLTVMNYQSQSNQYQIMLINFPLPSHFSVIAADLLVITRSEGTEKPSDSGAIIKIVIEARTIEIAIIMVKLFIRPP